MPVTDLNINLTSSTVVLGDVKRENIVEIIHELYSITYGAEYEYLSLINDFAFDNADQIDGIYQRVEKAIADNELRRSDTTSFLFVVYTDLLDLTPAKLNFLCGIVRFFDAQLATIAEHRVSMAVNILMDNVELADRPSARANLNSVFAVNDPSVSFFLVSKPAFGDVYLSLKATVRHAHLCSHLDPVQIGQMQLQVPAGRIGVVYISEFDCDEEQRIRRRLAEIEALLAENPGEKSNVMGNLEIMVGNKLDEIREGARGFDHKLIPIPRGFANTGKPNKVKLLKPDGSRSENARFAIEQSFMHNVHNRLVRDSVENTNIDDIGNKLFASVSFNGLEAHGKQWLNEILSELKPAKLSAADLSASGSDQNLYSKFAEVKNDMLGKEKDFIKKMFLERMFSEFDNYVTGDSYRSRKGSVYGEKFKLEARLKDIGGIHGETDYLRRSEQLTEKNNPILAIVADRRNWLLFVSQVIRDEWVKRGLEACVPNGHTNDVYNAVKLDEQEYLTMCIVVMDPVKNEQSFFGLNDIQLEV